MELTDTCKILLDKGTKQKVRCYKFFQTELKRDLAIHENIDHKTVTSISDVATGLRLCSIQKEVSKIKPEDIDLHIDYFIKHFTLEDITKELERIEKEQRDKGKQ